MDEDEQSFNKVYKKTVQTKDPCNSNNLFGQTKIALFEQMKEFVKNSQLLEHIEQENCIINKYIDWLNLGTSNK